MYEVLEGCHILLFLILFIYLSLFPVNLDRRLSVLFKEPNFWCCLCFWNFQLLSWNKSRLEINSLLSWNKSKLIEKLQEFLLCPLPKITNVSSFATFIDHSLYISLLFSEWFQTRLLVTSLLFDLSVPCMFLRKRLFSYMATRQLPRSGDFALTQLCLLPTEHPSSLGWPGI